MAIYAIVVSMFLSIALGYFLSNQMTKPIKKIQEIISSISEENIATKRLSVSNKNDEFTIVSKQ